MVEILERLERFEEFGAQAPLLSDEVRQELLTMSAASIDRYLLPLREARCPCPVILPAGIDVALLRFPCSGPGRRWSRSRGSSRSIRWPIAGTASRVNPCVKNRGHRNVVAGIELLDRLLPYPMRGMDFDNGGEFINTQLIGWAQERGIDLTRARAYKHHDNAHVE